MRPSQPSSFIFKKRDSCAVCNNIAPCPACAKGTQCQQIFRSSCQDCPVNKCVPIPGYNSESGPNKSALGGGLAALVIVAIGAAIGFWYWKKAQKRRRIALHEDAMERREKVRSEKEATTLQLGGGKSSDTPSPFSIDESELDGDTEYTQVTGVLNTEQDGLGSLAEPTAFRRRSFGAATHLSRITEGIEEEEEEEGEIAGNRKSVGAKSKRRTTGSARSNTISTVSGAGPRISIGSGTSSFGSHNIIPIAFKPSAAAESETSNLGQHSTSPIPLPTTAHRATGAPAIQVNQSRSGPVRPTRAPDLNLRLPETQRPHAPTTSSPLAHAASSAGEDMGTMAPAYDFMSIDPVATLSASGSGSALGPYSRSDRPLSTATVNTIGSTHSGSLSYVLSAPQVITPVSGDGVRRVQLGNGGKAQLVKVPSVKRKERNGETDSDPFKDAEDAQAELEPPRADRFGTGVDEASGKRASTVSTSTLGIPFGENPFGPSPFAAHALEQQSPMDAEERTSWLGGTSIREHIEGQAEADPFSDARRVSQPTTDADVDSILGQFPFDFTSRT